MNGVDVTKLSDKELIKLLPDKELMGLIQRPIRLSVESPSAIQVQKTYGRQYEQWRPESQLFPREPLQELLKEQRLAKEMEVLPAAFGGEVALRGMKAVGQEAKEVGKSAIKLFNVFFAPVSTTVEYVRSKLAGEPEEVATAKMYQAAQEPFNLPPLDKGTEEYIERNFPTKRLPEVLRDSPIYQEFLVKSPIGHLIQKTGIDPALIIGETLELAPYMIGPSELAGITRIGGTVAIKVFKGYKTALEIATKIGDTTLIREIGTQLREARRLAVSPLMKGEAGGFRIPKKPSKPEFPIYKEIEGELRQIEKPPPIPIAKEPWQMTKKEMLVYQTEKFKIEGIEIRSATKRNLEMTHERVVREALSEGKPVPPEVLKDYPDLVKPIAKEIPAVAKVIPKELEPLAQEARKYKSAEEFAKAEGQTVYRASPSKFPTDNWNKGTYFAPTEQIARYYSESHLPLGADPSSIKVVKTTLPKTLLNTTNSGNAFILKTDFPVKSQLTDFYAQATGKITPVKGIPPVAEVRPTEVIPKPPPTVVKPPVLPTLPPEAEVKFKWTPQFSKQLGQWREYISTQSRLVGEDVATQRVINRVAAGVPSPKITKPETALLVKRIRDEARGAKIGFRVAQKETRDILINKFKQSQVAIQELKTDLINIIKQELPLEEQGRFLTTLAKQDLTRQQAWKTLSQVIKRQEILESTDLTYAIKRLSKMSGSDTVAADYNKRVSDLLTIYDFQNPSENTLKKLMGLNDYLEKNPIVMVEQPELVDKLKRLTKTPLVNLSIQQKQKIVRDLSQTIKQGKLKFLLKQRKLRREVDVIRNDLLSTTKNRDTQNRVVKSLRAWDDNTTPTPFIADKMDGYKHFEGANVRTVRDLGDTVDLARFKGQQEKLQVLDELRKVKDILSEEEEIALGLHLYLEQPGVLNEKAIQLILEKQGWSKIPAKTPEMQRMMDIMRNSAGTYYDDIARIYLDSKNELLGKVDNYFPVRRQRELVFREEIIPYRTKQTEQGFTLGRVEGVEDLPRLDIVNILTEHLDDVQYYINVQPRLNRLSLAINNPGYQKSAGVTNFNFWRDLVDITARHGGYSKAPSAPSLLGTGRRNLTVAYLGIKVSSTFLQPTAVLYGMSFANQVWGAKAASEVFLETAKTLFIPGYARKIIAQSKALQLRAGGEEIIEEILKAPTRTFWGKLKRASLKPLQFLDIKTTAGFQNAVEKVLIRNGIPDAKKQAEFFMQVISGTNNPVYRPMLLAKGGEWGRAAASLQNFIMHQWGNVYHSLIRGGLTQTGFQNKYRALIGLGLVTSAVIAEEYTRAYINYLISGGKEPDVPLATVSAMAIPSQVPFFGHLFSAVAMRYDPDLNVPITSSIEDIFGGAHKVIWRKTAEAKLRGLVDAVGGFVSFLGIPTKQITQIVKGRLLPVEKAIKVKFPSGSKAGGKSNISTLSDEELIKLLPDDVLLKLLNK